MAFKRYSTVYWAVVPLPLEMMVLPFRSAMEWISSPLVTR